MAAQQDRMIIRLPEVIKLTGLSRSVIYAKMDEKSPYHDPDFPRSFPLSNGPRGSKGWFKDQIRAWQELRHQTIAESAPPIRAKPESLARTPAKAVAPPDTATDIQSTQGEPEPPPAPIAESAEPVAQPSLDRPPPPPAEKTECPKTDSSESAPSAASATSPPSSQNVPFFLIRTSRKVLVRPGNPTTVDDERGKEDAPTHPRKP